MNNNLCNNINTATLLDCTNIFNNPFIKNQYVGDEIIQGLDIISKYINYNKDLIITDITSNALYTISILELINRGIIIKDVYELKRLSWGIDENLILYSKI